MDVICEHCEAEYEFDETLLSDKGTTVKCSACSHVFRVLPPQRAGGRPPLMLRRASDGSARELGSLRELQQRIRAGEAALDDEIGREGTPFRKLREVPELKNFFGAPAAPLAPASSAPPGPSGSAPLPAAALDKPGVDKTLLGTSPTARPPAPYHDPAFPAPAVELPKAPAVPRAASAPRSPSPAPVDSDEAKAAMRTMAGMGPLSPPRPPLPAYAGPSDTPAANEPPAAVRPSPRPPAAHAEMPTLLGTPAANLPKLEPAAAVPHAPRSTPASGLPAAQSASPSPLPERGPPPGAASLPRFELPGRAPESKAPAPMGRAWASAPPPSGPPAPASWAAKSAAPVLASPSPSPMRLYLPDDDAPPARAMRRTSRLWLVALLALVGVGGWIGVHALSTYGGDEVAVAPMATPTTPPAAATPVPPPEPPPDQPAKPEPAAEPTSTKPAAAEKPAAEKPAAKPAAEKPAPAASAKPADKPAKPAEPARPKPEDYAQLVAKAGQLSSKGDQAGAIKAYQAALALRPTGSDANSGLGFALLKANKPTEALPLLDRAAENGFVEANIGLGDAYRKLGQPSSAIEAYRAYLERQPDGSRAAYARSWLDKLEKGGDRPREARARDEAPAPAPDDGYRPAGELLAPSEPAAPAEEAPPPPQPAPAEEEPAPAGEANP